MEKEHQPDSMATVTMKPDYPPSEVYSTSEPPPAYRRGPSNSVQIARIAALTVLAASFILGAFILASSYVSARASCHQLEQLDAMLDKELALEGRSYGMDGLLPDEPLPVNNAHALHGVPPQPLSTQEAHAQPPVAASHTKEDALNQAESKLNEDSLQKIDNSKDASEGNYDSSESDNSADEDDIDDDNRQMFKLPIQFDLDELAGAFLANNQKGRMNCIVERRQEQDQMARRFPFNIFNAFAAQQPQAERVAIICHGGNGDEPRPMIPEPASQVFAFPLAGPMRLPLRPQAEPERPMPAKSITLPLPMPEPRMPMPEQRMPMPDQRMPINDQRMPFGPLPFIPQSQSAPFPLPMPWDSSEESMELPRGVRIHVQRVIAIPSRDGLPSDSQQQYPQALPQNQDQNEVSVVHQFVPQPAPIQDLEPQPEVQKMEGSPLQMGLPWGLTPEDLQIIHRTAEDVVTGHQRDQQQQDNDMQEVKTIVNTLAAAAAEAQAQADAEQDRRQNDSQTAAQEPAQDTAQDNAEEGVAARAPRTILLPKDLPMELRPHYVQPRSVRSVDSVLHRERRVKRCACDCK